MGLKLRFHPTHPSWLLSGSTDGLVNVYDVNVEDEEDALVQIINHGSSIHHAGFLNDVDVFALSHDEMFSVHRLSVSDADNDDGPPVDFGDLREKLACGYVVQVLRDPAGAVMVVGASHKARSSESMSDW